MDDTIVVVAWFLKADWCCRTFRVKQARLSLYINILLVLFSQLSLLFCTSKVCRSTLGVHPGAITLVKGISYHIRRRHVHLLICINGRNANHCQSNFNRARLTRSSICLLLTRKMSRQVTSDVPMSFSPIGFQWKTSSGRSRISRSNGYSSCKVRYYIHLSTSDGY